MIFFKSRRADIRRILFPFVWTHNQIFWCSGRLETRRAILLFLLSFYRCSTRILCGFGGSRWPRACKSCRRRMPGLHRSIRLTGFRQLFQIYRCIDHARVVAEKRAKFSEMKNLKSAQNHIKIDRFVVLPVVMSFQGLLQKWNVLIFFIFHCLCEPPAALLYISSK